MGLQNPVVLKYLFMKAKIGKSWYKFSAAVNCAVTDTTSIHNGVPLISTLKKDDSFWAGDFEVKVTESTGTGIFFGKGIIQVPYLQQAKQRCQLCRKCRRFGGGMDGCYGALFVGDL